VLASRSDPERVYAIGLRHFSPLELAEAFAAAHKVASPTQLKQVLKQDPRDLLGTFRRLAPARRPIGIQRLSLRRVALAVGMLLLFAVAINGGIHAFFPAQNKEVTMSPECRPNDALILMAQAVPSADRVPCIATLPSGLSLGTVVVQTGRASFWLDSDRGGNRAVLVTLTPPCQRPAAPQVPTDEAGTLRFEDPVRVVPRYQGIRTYTFLGGCVT